MKIPMVFLLSMALVGCFDKTDEQYKAEALSKVTQSLSQLNPKDPCAMMLANKKVMFGDAANKKIMQMCGFNFDTDKPLSLSEVKIYRNKIVAVCGIVSGHSRAGSNIGSRFVYLDGDNSHVYIKQHVYGSNENLVSAQKTLLELYNQSEKEYCK